MTTEVASPFSTGGGGQFFEALSTGKFPAHRRPGTLSSKSHVHSVRFQGKQAGYATDDVVVEILSDLGQQHRLLAQVKHHAAITKSDH